MSAEAAVIAARFVEYAATAVLCGLPLLLLHNRPARAHGVPWAAPALALAAVLALAATAAWLAAQTALMGGAPLAPVDPAALRDLALHTPFGRAALVRAAAAALILLVVRCRPGAPAAALGAAAVASLAWGGHGAAGEGVPGLMHTAADIVHLLAAALWLGALLAFVLLTVRPRQPAATARALAAFSGVGAAAAALLVLTGLVNSWFLIGPDRLAAAPGTLYGQLLAAKLALFAAMLGLAALNRYRLVPAFRRSDPAAFVRLRRSLRIEMALGAAILAFVSWLGTLEPPA